MILDIADLLVHHRVANPGTAPQLRVAFLKTTEPTFLVFDARQRHPRFVVKIGGPEALADRFAVTSRLQALLPDGIAKPIGVFPLDDRRALFVEEGLPGVPWFRLGDRYRTIRDWRALRTRAIDRLRQFHAAVAHEPAWVGTLALGDDVHQMARRLRAELPGFEPRVETLIDAAASELVSLNAVRGVNQHGDFVLNNLLFDEHQLYILDLADFGRRRAPFVDAFALAHSVNLLAREHVEWPHLTDDLAACAVAEADAGAFTPRQKLAFFVYFLLAAMVDTLQRPTRSGIRSIYRSTFRDLLDDASRYEHAFAVAFPSRT